MLRNMLIFLVGRAFWLWFPRAATSDRLYVTLMRHDGETWFFFAGRAYDCLMIGAATSGWLMIVPR